MDAVTNCRICYEPFSEERIPKIFLCGHTFCLLCIEKFEERCPMCQKEIILVPDGWPTNYLALQASEEVRNNSTADSILANALRTLEQRFSDRRETVLTRHEEDCERVEEQESMLSIVNECIPRITELLTMDSEVWNTTETKNQISELEHEFEKVDKLMKNWRSFNVPTYSINSYIGTQSFLYDIANRLHKGEEIYAFDVRSNNCPRFDKITLMKNRIFISALDMSSVDRDSSLVSFQDLKKCITRQNLQAHLRIGERLFHFHLKWSNLTSSFIKLCTGENGPMFKGLQVNWVSNGNCLALEKGFKNLDANGLLDYFDACNPLKEEETSFDFATIVVSFSHQKSQNWWKIRKYFPDEVGINIVAQMNDVLATPLSESDGLDINDSGISLSF